MGTVIPKLKRTPQVIMKFGSDFKSSKLSLFNISYKYNRLAEVIKKPSIPKRAGMYRKNAFSFFIHKIQQVNRKNDIKIISAFRKTFLFNPT
jgi:hypothetical protein